MGTSASRQADSEGSEIKSLESRLSSLGDLPAMRTLFSHLSPSSAPIPSDALKEHFELKFEGISCPPSSQLSTLSQTAASTIIDTVFQPDENGVSWKSFLEGMEKCHQPSASVKLQILLCFFCQLNKKAGLPTSLNFDSEDFSHLPKADFTGHLTLTELQDLIWLCWLMMYHVYSHDKVDSLHLPVIDALIKSAQLACSDDNTEKEVLPMEKLYKWMLLTIPRLPFALFDYIQACLHQSALACQGDNEVSDAPEEGRHSDCLAHEGSVSHQLFELNVAWVIGLSLTDTLGDKLIFCSFPEQQDAASPLYRSSIHGKGMNRFWVHMEGYEGAVLMLVQGVTFHNMEENSSNALDDDKWLLGFLISDGFVNKSCYYGDRGCCIFAIDPVMRPFHPTGSGRNIVYSYSHVATNASYLEKQKGPEGIAFGGDIGKERLFLDKDFMHVIIRHHAVDKTYESGSILPNQGYHTIKGKVINVEVWGLGGAAMMEKQAQYQNRKALFLHQNRKVDLKAFGNWADSPEKLMLDMVSDPNRGQRQDR